MKTGENQFDNSFDMNESNLEAVDLSSLLGGDEPTEEPTPDIISEVEAVTEEVTEEVTTTDDLFSDDVVAEDKVEDSTETTDEVEEVEKPTDSSLKSLTKKWLGESFSVIQEGEDGEDVEVSIDDLDIDEEMFIDLVNSKIQEEKEKASENKVSTENISDFTKHLINIENNGGNVEKALQVYNQVLNPLDSLDMESEEGQIQAIYLRNRSAGKSDEDTSYMIEGLRTKGLLKQKAFEYKEELEEAANQHVLDIEKQAEQKQLAAKKFLKDYKKSLKDHLQTLPIKDSFKNKIVEAATKRDDNKQFELDKIINDVRRDPAKVAELAFFLLDKETYLKQATKEAVTETKKEVTRRLKLVPNKKKSNTNIEKVTTDTDTISIEDLIR